MSAARLRVQRFHIARSTLEKSRTLRARTLLSCAWQFMNNRFQLGYTLPQWLAMNRSNPNVYGRVVTALHFLQAQFPRYTQDRLLSELVCHDYSQNVSVVSLPAGTQLIGYKSRGAAAVAGSYFAPVGTPLHRVGIGYEGLNGGVPMPKQFHRYRVKATIPQVLKTICAPARDMWSNSNLPFGQLAGGGGVQYVVPNVATYLESMS